MKYTRENLPIGVDLEWGDKYIYQIKRVVLNSNDTLFLTWRNKKDNLVVTESYSYSTKEIIRHLNLGHIKVISKIKKELDYEIF